MHVKWVLLTCFFGNKLLYTDIPIPYLANGDKFLWSAIEALIVLEIAKVVLFRKLIQLVAKQ